MEGKITQVTLVVKDQAKSLAFYLDQVGFETKTDVALPGGHRWVSVGPKGQELELALFPIGGPVDPQQQARAKDWAPARMPPIVVRVADCRKVYAELHGRGVPFFQPPADLPWGTAATFEDPDGNLFSLVQPPSYPKPG